MGNLRSGNGIMKRVINRVLRSRLLETERMVHSDASFYHAGFMAGHGLSLAFPARIDPSEAWQVSLHLHLHQLHPNLVAEVPAVMV